MYRPGNGLVISSAMAMLLAPGVFAQAVPILPTTGSTTRTTSTTSTTPMPSASPVDLTQMNWRFGQLSPYAQQPITGSVTTQTTATAPGTTTSNANLFVGSTLATQGSLITSGTTNAAPLTQPTTSGSSSNLSSSTYVSRFVTFDNLVPNFGVTPTLTPPPTENFVNLTTFTQGGSALTSVPEPTTWVMFGGLLALVGYGYSRRKLKPEEKPSEGTTEPVSV